MEGRQNLAGLLSLSVVPAGCLPSRQGAVCLSWMQKSCQGCQWCRVPSSILSGCRVCSHGCKRAARAASGAVCRLPSCQGAVCLSWMQKSCQGCQWCRVCCLPSCQGAVCLSWMQKSCQRVPTGAYCLQNWQSRHTKLSYIIECVKYHRFIECAKYHRFLVEK